MDYKEIETFEQILEQTGETLESFTARTVGDEPDEVAYKQVKSIAKAYNGDWVVDRTNPHQYKYYPIFYNDPVKGLVFDDVRFWFQRSRVGSHLCFESEEKAMRAGKKFLEIYKKLL